LTLILIHQTSPCPPISEEMHIVVREYAKIKQNELQHLQKQNYINNILHVIKIIESKGNYKAKGKSGEYGAYQFTSKTWNAYCTKYFKKYLLPSPENQDLIAFLKVGELVDKGYSLAEIASIWNSGSPQWKNRIGVNQYGVKYNVPKYVSKVVNLFTEEFSNDTPLFEHYQANNN